MKGSYGTHLFYTSSRVESLVRSNSRERLEDGGRRRGRRAKEDQLAELGGGEQR